MHLRCPLCPEPLLQSERQWRCVSGHCFDIARQGYTHLLPVQFKRSAQPGDSQEMVSARQRFLEAGYYQPIKDRLIERVEDYSQSLKEPAAIVDAGCGEGYYSAHLARALPNADIAAIDISKFALRSAARRSAAITWLVASASALPMFDHSVDIIISLFAPLHAAEFKRVLKPGGMLLVATTGPAHLIELRRLIYPDVRAESYQPAKDLAPHFDTGIAKSQSINEQLRLPDNPSIQDLLAMTPHYWRTTLERKQALAQHPELTVTLDIQLHSFYA